MYRVGTGWDAHAFGGPGPLRLGGVNVPHDRRLEGHSDGDALVHAVCDAILGAAGLQDIGTLFPASEPELKDVDSMKLLGRVRALAEDDGFLIVNIDSVIIAQAPRLAPHIDAMRAGISAVLRLENACVGIKVKSPEGLGAVGRSEGIAAQAVALLRKRFEKQ